MQVICGLRSRNPQRGDDIQVTAIHKDQVRDHQTQRAGGASPHWPHMPDRRMRPPFTTAVGAFVGASVGVSSSTVGTISSSTSSSLSSSSLSMAGAVGGGCAYVGRPEDPGGGIGSAAVGAPDGETAVGADVGVEVGAEVGVAEVGAVVGEVVGAAPGRHCQ